MRGVKDPIGFHAGADLDYTDVYSALMAEGKAFPRSPQGGPVMQGRNFAYHFENERLVTFLERYTADQGVTKMDDTVVDVRRTGDGDDARVTDLVLKGGGVVTADLFVDGSGFQSKLLGGAMAEPFVSYKSTLFCDRAVVGGWDRDGEPTLAYTTCDTMRSDWAWQIEHEGRINRGYVYSSVVHHRRRGRGRVPAGGTPRSGPTRVVKFVSGRYRRAWAGNVVGIGNAAGFVEPLEATAIGAVCMQGRLLAEALDSANRRLLRSTRRLYNDQCERNWDSIRNFLAVHYKYNTLLDTPFWRAIWADCDLAGAEPIVDYYRGDGTQLVLEEPGRPARLRPGQRLLHHAGRAERAVRRARPGDPRRPRRAMAKLFADNRQAAQLGLTVEESLRMIRDPRWQWAA